MSAAEGNMCLSRSGPAKEGQRSPNLALDFPSDALSYSDRIGLRICHHPRGVVLPVPYCTRSPLSWMGSNEKGKMTLHLEWKLNDSGAFFKWEQSLTAQGRSQCPYKSSSEGPAGRAQSVSARHGSAPATRCPHCQLERPGFTDHRARWHRLPWPSV